MIATSPISPVDEEFLFLLYANVREPEMQASGFDETMKQAFLRMQWNAQRAAYAMRYPHANHERILVENVPVGRMLTNRSDTELRLVDLSILSAYRNRGFGTHLLEALKQEASASRLTLSLSVLRGNPARRLYERMGFASAGGDDVYEQMNWSLPPI
ncbi:GNAT family N-acetyltransferase [Paenibacillus sp. LHD-117]|uniref:GNAT family N-acetyltransferase n=1 Tax=Paenibacillus sp. LHD-117 TaxID=3071412 RepID=UPI0027E08F85|nr:GNAT family N-acetyltransferase [Paenibacillus sp. LHD-117]MDQ6419530.1 GNAT family N-acetyltransferase [Paenibacillus sp. LHD-117]